MKAEELMIGNWVLYKDIVPVREDLRGKPVQVDLYTLETIANHPRCFEYIPLSPEILEKCGFVKFKDSDTEYALCYDNHVGLERFIGYSLHNQILTLDHYYNGHNKELYFTHIEYLHQLQNLYYSLTHTPLKIEL